MNERIREITGQVLDELVPETWTALGYDQIKEIQRRTAELIVADCVSQLAWVPQSSGPEGLSQYNQGWVNGRALAVEHIKQHFGVDL